MWFTFTIQYCCQCLSSKFSVRSFSKSWLFWSSIVAVYSLFPCACTIARWSSTDMQIFWHRGATSIDTNHTRREVMCAGLLYLLIHCIPTQATCTGHEWQELCIHLSHLCELQHISTHTLCLLPSSFTLVCHLWQNQTWNRHAGCCLCSPTLQPSRNLYQMQGTSGWTWAYTATAACVYLRLLGLVPSFGGHSDYNQTDNLQDHPGSGSHCCDHCSCPCCSHCCHHGPVISDLIRSRGTSPGRQMCCWLERIDEAR